MLAHPFINPLIISIVINLNCFYINSILIIRTYTDMFVNTLVFIEYPADTILNKGTA